MCFFTYFNDERFFLTKQSRKKGPVHPVGFFLVGEFHFMKRATEQNDEKNVEFGIFKTKCL